MGAASIAVPLRAVDDEQRRRELAESERLLARVEVVKKKADEVAWKVRRMNRIYHERLVGNRDRVT